MQRIKIWLDCDPGHDDAMAIILAGYSDQIELLGISTVVGNQTVEKTTINALKICEIAGLLNIDVVKGSANGIIINSQVCPEIHGESGLGGSDIKMPKKSPILENPFLYIYKKIMSQQSKVIIVITGQHTNIALLIKCFPDIKEKIERIIFLGGAIGFGNISPAAEFNILNDPEAAHIIIESGIDIVMIPIEVSHTVLADEKIIQRIEKFNSKFSKVIIDLLNFFKSTYKSVFNFDFPPLHDPIAIYYVINPSDFETKKFGVQIELQSQFCNGRTLVDLYSRNINGKQPNVTVCLKVNISNFWDSMIMALEKANKNSYLNN